MLLDIVWWYDLSYWHSAATEGALVTAALFCAAPQLDAYSPAFFSWIVWLIIGVLAYGCAIALLWYSVRKIQKLARSIETP